MAEEVEAEQGPIDPALAALWDETATSTADPRDTIKPRIHPTTLELPADELQILGELGRGGAGRVMAARQLLLAREVAVKELQRKDASTERWVRFLSEAIVTASLEHPNIVPVHELRQAEDGGFRLVMKKVDGQTWRALAATQRAEGNFDLDRHIEILLRVCDAMAFAHDRGILHLDLKPTNIMVGSFGEVQVMDWGCAHAYRGDWPRVVPRMDTAVKTLHGSPAYMAPEQARGDIAAFGPVTDVYLLAMTVLEVLFDAARKTGGVRNALQAASRGEIPWPRTGLMRKAGFGRVLARALQNDPAKRYRSIASFAKAVRAYQAERQQRVLVRGAQRELRAASGSDHASQHFENAILLSRQVEERSSLRSEADAVHYDALVAYAGWCLEHDRADQAEELAEEAASLAEAGELAERREHVSVQKKARALGLGQRRVLQQSRRLRLLVGGAAAAVILLLAMIVGWLGERALRRQAIHDSLETVQQVAAHVHTALALVGDGDPKRELVLTTSLEEALGWYGHPGLSKVLGITIEGGRWSGTVIGERQVKNTSVSTARALTGLPAHIEGYPLDIPTHRGWISAWRFKSRVPDSSGTIGTSRVAVWLDVNAEGFNAASRQLWIACLTVAAAAIACIGIITLRRSDAREVAAAASPPPSRRRRR